MLDREIFFRPIAHRGLHNTAGGGLIENTGPAFEAAIAKGYGIECDIRPGRDGLPLVFHDATTKRLMDQDRDVATLITDDLTKLAYQNSNARLLSFADCLSLVVGRVPLMVEIKSEWETPDPAFIQQVAELANAYHGAIACKSFDPAVMIALQDRAPAVQRGIVSCNFLQSDTWMQKLGSERCYRLTHLLESGPVAPTFYSYDVKALPSAVTRFTREVQHLPLFTWTVRTRDDWQSAKTWADAAIFEGSVPEGL